MSRLEEYVPIENAGVVATSTNCRTDADGNALPEPVTVTLVRFPSVHGGLIHKVNSPVAIGDRVRVVFKEVREDWVDSRHRALRESLIEQLLPAFLLDAFDYVIHYHL